MHCSRRDEDRPPGLRDWLQFLGACVGLALLWLIFLPFRLLRRPRQLTPELAVSPDPPRVAFTACGEGGADVYLWDVTAARLSRAAKTPGEEYAVAWLPDGERIVHDTMKAGLTVCRADGTEARTLTFDEGCWDSHPCLSPDGRTVLFQRSAACVHYPNDLRRWYGFDAWLVDVEGGPARRLTHLNSGAGLHARWLRSGTEFSYKFGQVYRCDLDGHAAPLEFWGSCPTPSPTDDLMVFVDHGPQQYRYEVYRRNLDGSDPRRLAPGTVHAWNPAFSPDGEWVYFRAGEHDRTGSIWRVHVDGSELTKVVPQRVLRRPMRYLGGGKGR